MKANRFFTVLGAVAAVCGMSAAEPVIVATDAYRWQGDTIYQDEFKAWSVSPYEIHSTYHGRPGYFMPVEQTWKQKNDLSKYPVLKSNNMLHEAIFNMAMDEMVNAVEPDTTLRTGKEWAGVWTRDVSYSIILSMAYMQPEASMISLMKKVNPSGQIIQDTGSGGAWPISTDRMVWTIAAWEIYKVTGDKKWIEYAYPIVARSLAKDEKTVYSDKGLVKGETSFIDWREQSYPRWMQTVDISQSEAMGTNVMYAAALKCAGEMAEVLGKKKEAAEWAAKSADLAKAIDTRFWMPDKGYYGMYTYGPENAILNPRAETLGLALSILYDIAPEERQKSISENNPQTPFGVAIFYPQIPDMPNYHNNALWPWVGSYWAIAQAKQGNEDGVMEGIGAIFRPAALFTTNKENFNLDNGDYYTELNSSNMLWCLSGNIALTTRILFGIHYEKDGLLIKPFVPKALEATRSLDNFSYRGATLNLTVEGYGDSVKELYLNGKSIDPNAVIPAKKLKGTCDIRVVMDNEPIPAMKINRQPNLKTPIMPIAWLAEDGKRLEWNPIEYIAEYSVLKDGKEVGRTRQTNWAANEPGVWQVVGIAGDGTPSFASQPRDNRPMQAFQMNGEKKAMTSPEVSYQPATPIAGFTGNGFAESDKTSAPASAEITAPADGEYLIEFIYANGNGPVNTENKAAIRSLYVDGQEVGTVVLPHRGVANWNDWGYTNQTPVKLVAGKHTVELRYNPEDENMNIATNHALIDRVNLIKK